MQNFTVVSDVKHSFSENQTSSTTLDNYRLRNQKQLRNRLTSSSRLSFVFVTLLTLLDIYIYIYIYILY